MNGNMNTDDDALVLTQLRNQFYKKKYYAALVIYIFCLIAIITLISLLIYITRHPTRPLYFLTDSVGRLIEEVPVIQPGMSNDAVAAWVVEAVEAAYSYDYVNYRAQLQN